MGFLFIVSFLALATSARSGFPDGKCTVRSCLATPYDFPITTDTLGKFCFTVQPKQCMNQGSIDCCGMLTDKFEKVVIKSKPECKGTVRKVTVDGVTKGGGVYFDLYGNQEALLRLTAFRSNYTMMIGKVVCVELAGECPTISMFCGPDCRVAMFDPATHLCCPTCPVVLSSQAPAPAPAQVAQPSPSQGTPQAVPPPRPQTAQPKQKLECICEVV